MDAWINFIDPLWWFQWYFKYWLGKRSLDDERQINRWQRIVSRFERKLVRMTKDGNGRFDDYSVSLKIKQIFTALGL